MRLFGHASIAELRGRPFLDQIAPSHREQIAEMVALRARGGNPPNDYQTHGLRKDGTEVPFEVTTTRVLVADGPLTIAFIKDVSEREEALQGLRVSEEKFCTLSAAAFEGVLVHAEGRVVLANEPGATMHGFDSPASMVGASVADLIARPSRVPTCSSTFEAGRPSPARAWRGVATAARSTRRRAARRWTAPTSGGPCVSSSCATSPSVSAPKPSGAH